MASSGYMTYADFKTIWSAEIVEGRFNLINVRMGEILNFTVRKDKDSQTDVTNTKIKPMLEQASEEGLLDLMNAAKSNKFSDVWQFINSRSNWVMSRLLFQNRAVIDEIKEVLESKLHLKYSGVLSLPSHSDVR